MFGYISLWVDLYPSRKGGVGTDPKGNWRSGYCTDLSTLHSQYHRTRFKFSSKLYPSPPSCRSISGDAIPRLATSAVESGYYYTQLTVVGNGK